MNEGIFVQENRYLQLIEKEKRLHSILAAYPEIESGQKLTSMAKKYKSAFAIFVNRVDEVLSAEEFVGIFQIAYAHGFEYKGQSLAPDIANARKLLGIK